MITNTTVARIAIPNARSQPTSKAFLNTAIHAMKARIDDIAVRIDLSPNVRLSTAEEIKNTIAYIIGPTAVTNIARVNLARLAVSILAAIQTGIETTIHNTSKPMIIAAAEVRKIPV
jgi:hypothetical protein